MFVIQAYNYQWFYGAPWIKYQLYRENLSNNGNRDLP